jgi:hypothetical protein
MNHFSVSVNHDTVSFRLAHPLGGLLGFDVIAISTTESNLAGTGYFEPLRSTSITL